jgi:UDP-N-acetylglucosamine--N-acetylmuramyl-(pentapeptide) pyrophosphoryl-undecaprenol N-acetylglucosamine transferase
MKERDFLMAGGGTGGHVIPGLAVAGELRARGHRVSFAGTEFGIEAKLVPAAGFDLRRINIGGLNRVGLRQAIVTLGRLPIATVSSDRCVRSAAAVFSMGGYVAGPPVLAAILRRVPVVVMEPNAVPGFTNRSISRMVARALVSFPETAAFFPRGRTEVTGLPVREEFFRIQPKVREPVLHLLITGGSQGSRTLNHAALQSWPLCPSSPTWPPPSPPPIWWFAAPAPEPSANWPPPASRRFSSPFPTPPTITRPATPRPWSAAARRAWCPMPR